MVPAARAGPAPTAKAARGSTGAAGVVVGAAGGAVVGGEDVVTSGEVGDGVRTGADVDGEPVVVAVVLVVAAAVVVVAELTRLTVTVAVAQAPDELQTEY